MEEITQHVLAKEFFEVFGIDGEPLDCWIDTKSAITVKQVLNFKGKDKVFTEGYSPRYMSTASRRIEHIQRIRSLMQLSPLLWKPIMLDMNWNLGTVVIYDGHHRAFAAKCMNLTVIPIVWSGVKKVLEENFPRSFQIGLMK